MELLAFLTAQPDVPYAISVIRQRGINFSNDAALLESLRIHALTPELVDAIAKLKPVAIVTPSLPRANAFGNLTNAISDKNRGKVADALADYKRALQDANDSATLHMAYAGQLILSKNYSEAETQYRRSLELWPDNAEAMVWLASALSLQSRDSEAVPILRRALALYPDHRPAVMMLGMALARNWQFSEAVPVLEGAVSKYPQMSFLRKMLGVSLLQTGDAQGAAIELDSYLKTDPENAEAHYFLGVASRQLGKRDESLEQFRIAARIDPNNPIYSALLNPEETQTPGQLPPGPHPDDAFFSANTYSNSYFHFSYEYPKSWVVLKAEMGKAWSRLGGAIIANGDPTIPDIVEAATRHSYPLLVVAEREATHGRLTQRSIQVHALDSSVEPKLKSAEDFAKGMAALYDGKNPAVQVIGAPEKLAVSGRDFWRVNFKVHVNDVTGYSAEFVTLEKAYILVFVFASPDSAGLDQIVNTIYSLRFSAPPLPATASAANSPQDDKSESPYSPAANTKPDETTPKKVGEIHVQMPSAVTILTPTEGVDFRPYINYFLSVIKRKWYDAMPDIASNGAKGKTVLIFGINKDGTLEEGPSIESTSGVTRLDEAAQLAIRSAAPFDALPAEFKGPYIRIRLIFLYNLPFESLQK
ncbi:MAG TPA: tetratricopeptide repeat protein [Candidatus Sulfotelmatobacter sp.]|nr:tetratricopeptide repeat protein [Candidatus Sulfotelmatobacter sp.]